jgi:small subunit ribosomal protein S9
VAVEQWNGTGRRKTSRARVYLRPGTGNFTINDQDVNSYFGSKEHVIVVQQPLDVTDTMTSFDVVCRVDGGGKSGQAGAILLGLARALVQQDEDNQSVLKKNGFLTRDSRMVERKKYGQRGARRKFQFSKR